MTSKIFYLDINHFIQKDEPTPKTYINKEFFNYQLPKALKLKDIETAQEIIEAERYFRQHYGWTDEVLIKTMVKACCCKSYLVPTKKDLKHQLQKMKKKNKPIIKRLRDYEINH